MARVLQYANSVERLSPKSQSYKIDNARIPGFLHRPLHRLAAVNHTWMLVSLDHADFLRFIARRGVTSQHVGNVVESL